MRLSGQEVLSPQERATAIAIFRQLQEKMEGVWNDFFAAEQIVRLPTDVIQGHLRKELRALDQQIAKALCYAFGTKCQRLPEFQRLQLSSASSNSFMDVQLLLEQCLVDLQPTPHTVGPSTEPHLPSVLIVDDSEDSQYLCVRALRQAGLELAAVSSAEEALYHLKRSPVDVMVLDFMLPPPLLQLQGTPRKGRVLNGVGLMHEALRQCVDLQILFISARSPQDLRAQGVPDHVPILQKPFRSEVFQETVRELLSNRKSVRPASSPISQPPFIRPRKYPRVIVRCPVTFEAVTMGTGELQDLSECGAKISSATPPSVGSHLTLKMLLPPANTIKINVAVVRWANHHMFGVEFLWVEPAVSPFLHEYVALRAQPM